MFDVNLFVEAFKKANMIHNMRLAQWTKAVKNVLIEMGENQNFEVYPNPHVNKGELLLDVAWYDSDGDKVPYVYRKMILGAESEWGSEISKKGNIGEILDDFYKLLDFKCEYKVMIYTTYSWDDRYILELRNELIKTLENYENHVIGEKYIFIEFQDREKAIYSFTINIPKNGKVSSIQINNIDKFPNCWG